jgi:hypothetical protein
MQLISLVDGRRRRKRFMRHRELLTGGRAIDETDARIRRG